MKYGIEEQLPPEQLDLLHRFHAALAQRVYQRTVAKVPGVVGNPLDLTITLMLEWDRALFNDLPRGDDVMLPVFNGPEGER